MRLLAWFIRHKRSIALTVVLLIGGAVAVYAYREHAKRVALFELGNRAWNALNGPRVTNPNAIISEPIDRSCTYSCENVDNCAAHWVHVTEQVQTVWIGCAHPGKWQSIECLAALKPNDKHRQLLAIELPSPPSETDGPPSEYDTPKVFTWSASNAAGVLRLPEAAKVQLRMSQGEADIAIFTLECSTR